ncbi:MAG: glycosyltransferase [Pseudomonadales bacterium]|nr:glycosyltransferase [Pseudomonadales bacterium]
MEITEQDKTLKVLHSNITWLNLTENWIHTQVYYLPDSVKSHIVCDETYNLEQFNLPNIHCQSASHWKTFLNYCLSKLHCRRMSGFLMEVARREKCEILHSHFGYNGWHNMPVASKAGLKHIVTFYGLDVNRFPQTYPIWRKRYVDMFSQVDCILCEGPYMAKSVIALGCPEEKVKVHHLGIEIDKIKFKPRQWSTKEPLRVLIAASFREKKGIPFALEALGRFKNEISIEVTIIGDSSNDPQSQAQKLEIMKVIQKYDLGLQVKFLGFLSHSAMLTEAQKHHILLSPSVTAEDGDSEGGVPVTIIEMAASGMQVLSSFHCDIPEVIEHGVSGLLAKERDIDGLIDNIQWLVDNPNHWGTMARNARAHIETEYDAIEQGKRLETIYREAVGS